MISVIIPAFNAAKRIAACLESVISQNYADIEIIVVDDYSCDDTGKIAREILDASGRKFRVITNDRNRGVSAARNTGIDVSQGKYICFVDADDVIRENFVSCLHDVILSRECDISFCGFVDRFTDGRSDADIVPADGEEISCGEDFILCGNIPAVWACMYGAEFLRRNNLRFTEGCSSGEDIDFITRALCRAESVSFVRECLYIYMHHPEMGSVRDNDTFSKQITRYGHNTIAQKHTAEYLCEYAKSCELREIAGRILLPQSVIRRLNLAAMKRNWAEYDSVLRDGEAMKILRRGICFFTLRRKPEVFMKAVMIMIMPGIYYGVRKG